MGTQYLDPMALSGCWMEDGRSKDFMDRMDWMIASSGWSVSMRVCFGVMIGCLSISWRVGYPGLWMVNAWIRASRSMMVKECEGENGKIGFFANVYTLVE